MSARGHRRGKEHERATAKALGGKRTGPLGKASVDVAHPLWAIECKERAKPHPAYVVEALAQARGSALEGQVPIAVFHHLGDLHSNDLVVMRLGDFADLHGQAQLPEAVNG